MPAQGRRASELQKWDLSLSRSLFTLPLWPHKFHIWESFFHNHSFLPTVVRKNKASFPCLALPGLAGLCWDPAGSCVAPSVYLASGCVLCVCSAVSGSLRPHGLQPAKHLCAWNFPGKNTGVGCHFLLQGIFPIQWWEVLYPIGKLLYNTGSSAWCSVMT